MSLNLNIKFTANQGLQNISNNFAVIAIDTFFSLITSYIEWLLFSPDRLFILATKKRKIYNFDGGKIAQDNINISIFELYI